MIPQAYVTSASCIMLALAGTQASDTDPTSSDQFELFAKVVLGQMVVLWSSATFLLAGAKEVNSIRDKAVTGFVDGVPVDRTYRLHIVKNDWIPILICVAITAFVYAWLTGIIAWNLAVGAHPWYSALYWALCVCYVSISMSWALTARSDYEVMNRAIDASTSGSSADSSVRETRQRAGPTFVMQAAQRATTGAVATSSETDHDSRPGIESAKSSPTGWRYQAFFQRLIDELRTNHRFTKARVAQPQNWHSFSSGTPGFSYGVSFNRGKRVSVELYIDGQDKNWNRGMLGRLRSQAAEIEKEFGESLSWDELENRRACRVACYRQGSIGEAQADVDEYLAWTVDRLLRMKATLGPRIQGMRKRAEEVV